MTPMGPTEPEPVQVEDRDAVRVLTLNRPQVRNAMSTALLGALLDAIGDAASDEGIRAIALTGARGHFSAGADLDEELDHDGTVRRMELFCELYEALTTCPTPTIAAVHGACVGGGAEMAAACDIRVADATANFRVAGAAMGYPVGAAKLIGLVGLGTAKDLALTGRGLDVWEAVRVGLVQRLSNPGAAVDLAVEVGAAVAENDADAVAALKRQFVMFSGAADRVAAENDAVRALAQAGGDYGALTMPDPRSVGGFAGGNWITR